MMFDSIVMKAHSALLAKGDAATAAIISAYAGRIEEARKDVGALVDPDQRSFLTTIIEGIGGDRTTGIAALRARVEAAPGDFQTLVWLVRVLRGAGDPTAEAFAERAGILRHDEAGITLEVLSVVPADDSDRWLGGVAGYPFAIYSRKGLLDAWPPQVLVIGTVKPS